MLKTLNRISILQPVFRTSSIWYNFIKQVLDWDKYNQVVSGLFLGVIPTATTILGDYLNTSSEKIISDVQRANPTKPLGLVVSITAADELAGEGFYGVTMVRPAEWKERKIEHLHVEMEDYTANVNMEVALETLKKMKQVMDSGKSVYIHCKAGRSRSAMFCAIYISLFLVNPNTSMRYTLPEAIQLIKQARSQIDIEKEKIELASLIITEAIARKIEATDLPMEKKPELSGEETSLSNRLNELLLETSTKENILGLPSTLSLIEYGCREQKKHPNKPSQPGLLVDELLELVRKPHSEQWFYCMFNETQSPFKEIADHPEAAALCEAFKTAIMNYLAEALACREEQILEIAWCERLTWELLSPCTY